MATVFISSTGLDLADYRAAVIEVCNRAGLVPIAMEFFESMGAGATEGSNLKLDEADVYLGIFAHRYGYIEAGEKSITEEEFDHAKARGLERLCFLVKPTYAWTPDAIDYEHHEKLERFKRRIRTSAICNEFTTVDDLRAKVLQSLYSWLQRHPGGTPAQPPATGPVPSVPPAPPLFIGRETEIRELRERAYAASRGGQHTTIVRGWPGVGKTTLLNALAHDPEMLKHFKDGVFWMTLGENTTAESGMATLCQQLGACEEARALALPELVLRVRSALVAKRALLILDDAWRSDDAAAFKQVVGPGCALLVTTRFGDVARELADVPGEQIYRLGVLSDEKGLELLRRLAPTVVLQHPQPSLDLVRDLEGLPLALRVAGRLLESEANLGTDVLALMQELRESHCLLDSTAPDDRFDPRTGTTPTIQLLLKSSTDRLAPEMRERFALLGVFAPKPATFDREAMAQMWQIDDALPTIRQLVDRGLLEPLVSVGRFQMHALLVLHAKSLLEP
ncbi:NB-ARC domain-containing protein [Pyxidicoccus caerfyrddinensis]|uniref:NB-ARC domain-containing protein n=1 Tax=Pyxidicoccus caerfyrddinensis TaxID=2709663 RepID=UPI0013D8F7F5|nr:NB-ARC domain-containing protein [Pyxidicoccus caerfyrddinensis]